LEREDAVAHLDNVMEMDNNPIMLLHVLQREQLGALILLMALLLLFAW